MWDDYQIASVSPPFGGNREFFELMKSFEIHTNPIVDKYKTKAAKYYRRKHAALLDGRNFDEEAPAKNWNEKIERT